MCNQCWFPSYFNFTWPLVFTCSVYSLLFMRMRGHVNKCSKQTIYEHYFFCFRRRLGSKIFKTGKYSLKAELRISSGLSKIFMASDKGSIRPPIKYNLLAVLITTLPRLLFLLFQRNTLEFVPNLVSLSTVFQFWYERN